MRLLKIIRDKIARRSSTSLINFYRKKGVKIGNGCIFRYPFTVTIDVMRPSLVSIGDNVDMNRNFSIRTHDFGHRVFVPLYGEFLSSSGKVSIGNNVYFGMNVTVLKGVTIGDNCIIGAGSIVTKSIPSNSVAVGVPCRVISTIEDYYNKRRKEWIEESIQYARSIKERFNREPTVKDFLPEFGLYVDSHNIKDYDQEQIKKRLGSKYDFWLKNHKAVFNGFDDFIKNIEK